MTRITQRLVLGGIFLCLSGCVSQSTFNDYKEEQAAEQEAYRAELEDWARELNEWVQSDPTTGALGVAEWLRQIKPYICTLVDETSQEWADWNCGVGPSGPPPPVEPDCDWGEVCPD